MRDEVGKISSILMKTAPEEFAFYPDGGGDTGKGLTWGLILDPHV